MDNRNTISNAIQNMIDEIIDENLFTGPRTTRNNYYTRRNSYENENLAIIQLLREIVHSYDENMREYSENMKSVLQIINIMVQRQYYSRSHLDPNFEHTMPTSNNTRNSTTSNRQTNTRRTTRLPTRTSYQTTHTTSPILSYYYYPIRDLSSNISNPTGFQDVIVAPTQEQINNASRTLVYRDTIELLNHRCPISLADFEEGDEIRQIVHCGHCFNEEAIQRWFRTNVRCPICRYDIRDFSNEETEPVREQSRRSVNENVENIQNITNNIFDGLTSSLANILNNYLENELDISNNLTYTFEVPIIFRDISNNSI